VSHALVSGGQRKSPPQMESYFSYYCSTLLLSKYVFLLQWTDILETKTQEELSKDSPMQFYRNVYIDVLSCNLAAHKIMYDLEPEILTLRLSASKLLNFNSLYVSFFDHLPPA
jgi:hypothetical protein